VDPLSSAVSVGRLECFALLPTKRKSGLASTSIDKRTFQSAPLLFFFSFFFTCVDLNIYISSNRQNGQEEKEQVRLPLLRLQSHCILSRTKTNNANVAMMLDND
jgi:hypothetical protein